MPEHEEAPFPFNKLNGPTWLAIFAVYVVLIMWASMARFG